MAKSYLDKDGLLYFLQKIRPSATPSMDGTASTGTSKRFAAEDHVHPTDTSLAPKASPAFTGTPTAPTAATGTTTTQLATTEFVANAVAASTSGVSDVRINGTSVVTSGVANIPVSTDSANGYMSSTDHTKLSGIEAGAEVNQNAYKRITIATGGDAPSSKSIDAATAEDAITFYSQPSGHIVLTADQTNKKVTISTTGLIATASKGAASGVCPLDANGKVDSSYLPSYVDDVIEAYPRSGQTELSQNWLSLTSGGSALTPETGKIYILMADSTSYATNTQFRWGGTAYVKMLDGGVTSITNAEIDTIVAA